MAISADVRLACLRQFRLQAGCSSREHDSRLMEPRQPEVIVGRCMEVVPIIVITHEFSHILPKCKRNKCITDVVARPLDAAASLRCIMDTIGVRDQLQLLTLCLE